MPDHLLEHQQQQQHLAQHHYPQYYDSDQYRLLHQQQDQRPHQYSLNSLLKQQQEQFLFFHQQQQPPQQPQQPQPQPVEDRSAEFDLDTSDIDTDSGNSVSTGYPPMSYIANVIANHLMPRGEEMFGRREDASCILKVGRERFYVHVQLLSARSPTFRRIFDDMMQNDAWGIASDSEDRSDDDGVEEEEKGDYGDDDESMQECRRFIPDHVHTGAPAALSSYHNDSHGMIQVIPLDLEAEELAHRVRRSLRIRDDHRDEEWDKELSDTDDYLPELSVAFEDPDGGHFRDTLLWVYTGDSKRWVNSFTPKNYEHILKNVFRLNMVTQQVLGDCQTWEEATHPDLGLQGLAHAHFFASLAAANDTH